MQINQVVVAGNLTRDPEVRFSSSGTAISNASIACNRKWKDKSSGEQKEEVAFLDVTAFGKQAESFGELRKGQNVVVTGRLKQDTWDDKKTGDKRSKIVIICESFPGLLARSDSAPAEDKPKARAEEPAAEANPDDDNVPF